MRNVNNEELNATSHRGMANIAASYAECGQDSYSEYGVGAALLVQFEAEWQDGSYEFTDKEEVKNRRYKVYAGCNFNLSGMEYKVHAEQLALFQLLLDVHRWNLEDYVNLRKMVVVTTENDLALNCGHCLQVTSGVCEHLDSDPDEVKYTAAAGQTTYDDRGNPDGVEWKFDEYTVGELIGNTYVNTKE